MKFDYTNKWIYKYENESFTMDFSFINDLNSGETLSSCTVTCTDSEGNDTTSAMISSVSVTSPKVYFDLAGGSADTTYELKLVGLSSGGNTLTHYITLDVYGSITLNANLGDPNANSYVTLAEANAYVRNKYGHNSKWDELSIEGKKRVLIEACKDISKFNFLRDPYYDNQALPFPDSDHETVSGNCATPITINSFKYSGFTSDTYGALKNNTDFWKYGTVHITAATPLHDIRRIETSNITTDVITVTPDFSATPTTNTSFRAFEPLDKDIKEAQITQALYIIDNTGNDLLYMYKGAGARRVQIGDVSVWFQQDSNLAKMPISLEAKKLISRYIRRTMKVGRA